MKKSLVALSNGASALKRSAFLSASSRGVTPAASAASATGSPCSSVPVRKKTSSPRWRMCRAITSAAIVVYAWPEVRRRVDVVDGRRDVEGHLGLTLSLRERHPGAPPAARAPPRRAAASEGRGEQGKTSPRGPRKRRSAGRDGSSRLLGRGRRNGRSRAPAGHRRSARAWPDDRPAARSDRRWREPLVTAEQAERIDIALTDADPPSTQPQQTA